MKSRNIQRFYFHHLPALLFIVFCCTLPLSCQQSDSTKRTTSKTAQAIPTATSNSTPNNSTSSTSSTIEVLEVTPIYTLETAKTALEEMGKEDQDLRAEWQKIVDTKGYNTAMEAPIVEEIKLVDADNVKQLEVIVEQLGFPKKSDVGEKAAFGAFLVVQHAPKEIIEKYLPTLLDYAKNKEADIKNVIAMEDRHLMGQDKPQKYGTQVSYVESEDGSKSYAVWKVDDLRKVARRRAKLQIEPLETYLRKYRLTLKDVKEDLSANYED